MNISTELNKSSEEIAIFINNWLFENKSFKLRSFYGESFTLLLFHYHSINDNLEILYREYDKKDKTLENFHFEFNNYAFIECLRFFENDNIKSRLFPLKFKGTKCTNWTLLRSNCKLKVNKYDDEAINIAVKKIKRFQLKSGLILDDPGVKSFQYHCFSVAMIGEIYISTKDDFFLNSFREGVEFILNFILPSGCTLYVGRGQEQSFGYGALIYILSLHYNFYSDKRILFYIRIVFNYLQKFKSEKNAYPLVLNESKLSPIQDVNLNDIKFSGWYQYNNYFDYLPFLAVFLKKSSLILENLDFGDELVTPIQISYFDNSFKKFKFKNYIAILSKPEGYWTNDLAIPLVYKNENLQTPLYGGDQYAEGIQNIRSLPLPFFENLNKSIRWRSISFLSKKSLIIINPLGIMFRFYKFNASNIIIKTYVLTIFKTIQPIFMLDGKDNIFIENAKSHQISLSNSASGLLKGKYSKGFFQKIIVKL